jgi:LPS-assembly protein
MKNKFKFIIIALKFYLLMFGVVFSGEQFNFDITEIEISENGNKFKGLKRGIITTIDGLIIEADEFEYNKISNILDGRGNIKIFDEISNLTIFTDNITYLKNEEEIYTRGNSKAYKEDITITSNKFNYKKNLGLLEAKEKVRIDDKGHDVIIFTDEIDYEINKDLIYTKDFTEAIIEEKYNFKSKNVFFDRNKMELSSNYNTKVTDNNLNLIELEMFKYLKNDYLLKGSSIIVTTNYNLKNSDKYFFSNGFFNLKKNNFNALETTILMHNDIFGNEDNDPRIKGISSFKKNEITQINKGIFTSCKKDDNCPPWSLKAEKVIHNKEKKRLTYDNAILNIYDVPVFYFPKFFHPDPSVHRQSGILKPQLNQSIILGSSIQIPYYHVVSDKKDLTITPNIFDNHVFLLQNEYRKKEEDSTFIADFGFAKGYKARFSNKKKNVLHFFSKYKLDLKLDKFIDSELLLNIQKVTNDTYLNAFDGNLRQNSLKPGNVGQLSSSLNLSLNHSGFDFSAGTIINEKLSGKDSDRYQFVLPYYDFSKSIPFINNFGSLNINSSGSNNLKDTNNLRSRIINDLNFNSSNFISKNGFKNNFSIFSKNLNTVAKNDILYKSSPQVELMGIFEAQSSLPLIKLGNTYDTYLTPKISYRFNPADMKDYSNENRKVSASNIFSINRLGLTDSFESGQSLTLGLEYKKENIENINKYFEFKIGSVFRDTIEKNIPSSSSLNQKSGNLIGSIKNNINDNFNLDYNFSLDNDLSTIEYNSIAGNLNINKFQTAIRYIEENGKIGDSNSIENTLSYTFDEKNYISFNTRRNRKINLTEYYDLIYEYKNDCLIAGLKYKKTYYQDRDVVPTENLIFTVTIFPLTTYEKNFDRGK